MGSTFISAGLINQHGICAMCLVPRLAQPSLPNPISLVHTPIPFVIDGDIVHRCRILSIPISLTLVIRLERSSRRSQHRKHFDPPCPRRCKHKSGRPLATEGAAGPNTVPKPPQALLACCGISSTSYLTRVECMRIVCIPSASRGSPGSITSGILPTPFCRPASLAYLPRNTKNWQPVCIKRVNLGTLYGEVATRGNTQHATQC